MKIECKNTTSFYNIQIFYQKNGVGPSAVSVSFVLSPMILSPMILCECKKVFLNLRTSKI